MHSWVPGKMEVVFVATSEKENDNDTWSRLGKCKSAQ
jgi:hypothetical protein